MEATNGGDLVIENSVNNTGTGSVVADGGTVTVGSGGSISGTFDIEGGGVAQIVNSSEQDVAFAGTGTLLLDNSQNYRNGVVSGFTSGDAIDLQDITSAPNEYTVWTKTSALTGGSGTLQVYNGSGVLQTTLNLAGTYTQGNFALMDSSGDAEVVYATPHTAAVADDGSYFATGQFTASDAVTWSIVGGTGYTSGSYNFGIHEFKVTEGGLTAFDDTFATVPPNGPAITIGSTPTGNTFFDSGLGTYAQGTGEALLEGSNAGYLSYSTGAGNYGTPSFGQFTTLLTGTGFDTTQTDDGLRSGTSFTASGLFDLVPASAGTQYGIRLVDRVGIEGANNNQPGTEVVAFGVTTLGNGNPGVFLSETNYETGATDSLMFAQINPNPSGADNEILLSLSNNAANNGQILATYTLEKSDGNGNEVADGPSHTLTAVGYIFDDSDWTRAQFFGTSPATPSSSPDADSVLQGIYGQLDVAQNGTWNYQLNPALATVKALAAGQTALDTFQVTATNAAGEQSSQTVSVTVTGANDAPVASAPAHYSLVPDTPLNLVNTGLSVSDPDGGSTIETATLSVDQGVITVAAGNSGVTGIIGGGTGVVTFSGTLAQINALLNTSTGTVVYNDTGASPGTSTVLTLTINDNGNNGGSALSGSASAVISVPPTAPEYLNWQHEIDIFAATQGTTTQWIVPNYDGLTSTVFTGTNFTYDPITGLPVNGQISSINLVDNHGNTLQTITNVSVALGDFGNYIGQAEALQTKLDSEITWSNVFDRNNGQSVSFTSTDIHLANTDGTFTDLIGTGFVQGSPPSGTVTSIEQLNASGQILNTVDLGAGISLSEVADALVNGGSDQFYELATQNNTHVTAVQAQAGSSNVYYTDINDSPGNHTFIGQPSSFTTVVFEDATSGVTVNLGQGTANWGGYHDTLTNISGVIGSSFADTIVGSNNGGYLDGGGAPIGSHDTLTGGSGSDTFAFAKGYGALTITNFDQGNGGGFSLGEGDQIQLNGLSNAPSLTQVGADTVADFGGGDTITFTNTTVAEIESANSGNNGGNNGGGNNNGPMISDAGNTVSYTGTPVFLDQAIVVSDADTNANITSVNAWICGRPDRRHAYDRRKHRRHDQ
jgi:VCBS repeat-containing protein